MARFKTVYEDCDILVVGGGMGGCGAAYEARHWGRDLKIVVAEKANIDRSGAVGGGAEGGAEADGALALSAAAPAARSTGKKAVTSGMRSGLI